MLGIGFHPDGAARLFGPCMPELSGKFTSVEDISTSLARKLTPALESPDPIAMVEAALLSALGSHDRSDLLVTEAAVGLSPKLFSRLQRFNHVFRVLETSVSNWAQTAAACGYYDQAHLIRDCKRFSGTTPAKLLAGDGDLARYFYCPEAGMSHSSKTV
jgi:methylphosphotriester-DNA--protein-cysteine methyltransferase